MQVVSSKNLSERKQPDGRHGGVGGQGQSGFSLIEVLMVMLIMGVGFLGLAKLQAISMRQSHSSYLRSQATFLAYDMLDRMRANPNVVSSGSYDSDLESEPTTHVSCEGTNASCSTSQLAQYDLNQWKCMLGSWNDHATCTSLNISGMLPSGDGSVSRSGDTVSVNVQWVDDKDGNTTSLTISTEFL